MNEVDTYLVVTLEKTGPLRLAAVEGVDAVDQIRRTSKVLWVQVLNPELLAQMQTIVNLYVKASAA